MPDITPQSGSDSSFDLLAEGVQRQLYRMGWTALRAIQARAIRSILTSRTDLLIIADTAGGKTEAAFLPLLSALSSEPLGSVRALYVGPLKALINDQFGRLEELCTYLEVPVYRWHGDVPAAQKELLCRQPGGVLLITPESIESLLINRTSRLSQLFGGLRAVVIDEVHSFLDNERGTHLASLLSRLRNYQSPDQPRFRVMGLSATVGDEAVALSYLSPDSPGTVAIIKGDSGGKEIQFRLYGYVPPSPANVGDDEPAVRNGTNEEENDSAELQILSQIATDLVEHCRGHANLAFANSKGDIEIIADLANERCRLEGLPESFLVHHGSLARDVREDTELTMKSGRPMTTVCSSTLEMGVDIGSVRTVGQIGAPWSVASLKQRMGRSGRRDEEPRRLRLYVDCSTPADRNDPLSPLPSELLQAIAICELMLDKWLEPPRSPALDLSTLAHQIISTIAECGAVHAADLHARLCVVGPFRNVHQPVFVAALRQLGKRDVVEQSPDGALILGLEGEHIRKQKDFYAAFASRTEFTIVAGHRTLGSLPIDTVPKEGEHLVFAARRWQVTSVDFKQRVITVVPAKRRKRPSFLGGLGDVHPRVCEQMRMILADSDVPVYLNSTAKSVLSQARAYANEQQLTSRRILAQGGSTCLWLTWTGTAAQRTLAALLETLGIEAQPQELAIRCRKSSAKDLRRALSAIDPTTIDLRALAKHVQPKQYRKFDHLFEDDLLDASIAADRLDWREASRVLQSTLEDRVR